MGGGRSRLPRRHRLLRNRSIGLRCGHRINPLRKSRAEQHRARITKPMLLHTMRDLLLRRHIRSMLRHILIRFQIHLVGGELPHKLTRGIRELDVLDTDFDDIETEPCRPRTRILHSPP